MTLDQLEVLKIIVEKGSFKKASETLHRAQSAISYAIHNLEDEIGFALFDRSRYRSQLTTEGQAFLRKSKEVLQAFKELETYGKALQKGCEPQVRVAVSALLPLREIIKALDQLKWRFPQTEVKLVIDVLGGDKLLLKNEVDLALTDAKTTSAQLETCSLGKIKLWAVIGRSHPAAKLKDKLRSSDLSAVPQVIVQSSPLAEERSAGVINQSNSWSVSEFSSKKELILSGLGWGYMPIHMIEEELKSEKLIKVEPEPFLAEIFLAKIKNKELGPSSDFLWQTFKKITV